MDALKDRIPDYARDLRLNLSSVLTPQGAPGLNESQLWMVAFAAAIASRNAGLARGIEAEAKARLTPVEAKAGQVLVRLRAAGLNRGEFIAAQGLHKPGAAKPAGKPVSCTVNACTTPSDGRSTQSKRSEAHSPQNPRGGHARVPHASQRVVASRPWPSRA